jgi:hypothetical protein
MARRIRLAAPDIGAAKPPGPPAALVPMSPRPVAGNAVSAGLIVAAEAQLGGTDNVPTRFAWPMPADAIAPKPGTPPDPSALAAGVNTSPARLPRLPDTAAGLLNRN